MDTSISAADKEVSDYLNAEMKLKGITQEDLQKKIGRSQGYISERLACKRSWALSELDRIAPIFGQQDAIMLTLTAHRRHLIDSTPISDDRYFTLAADTDPNKEIESETPDD